LLALDIVSLHIGKRKKSKTWREGFTAKMRLNP